MCFIHGKEYVSCFQYSLVAIHSLSWSVPIAWADWPSYSRDTSMADLAAITLQAHNTS